jgi:hypothetical protein
MRSLILSAIITLTLGGAALAQNDRPAADSPGNKAINSPDAPQPAAPVKGANSFTEVQAKGRIEKKGFSNVTELKKDNDGIWRGRAEKDGKKVSVSLDFEGNVFSN